MHEHHSISVRFEGGLAAVVSSVRQLLCQRQPDSDDASDATSSQQPRDSAESAEAAPASTAAKAAAAAEAAHDSPPAPGTPAAVLGAESPQQLIGLGVDFAQYAAEAFPAGLRQGGAPRKPYNTLHRTGRGRRKRAAGKDLHAFMEAHAGAAGDAADEFARDLHAGGHVPGAAKMSHTRGVCLLQNVSQLGACLPTCSRVSCRM